MLRHAEQLAPRDGRRYREFRKRVLDNDDRAGAIEAIHTRRASLRREFVLEGPSHADCLVECERAIIWIEGKRHDWLEPSTTWDVTRDQLARNVEAVWQLARERGKDYWFLICHEYPLKHHEAQLVSGYRTGTWIGGGPHLSETQRRAFSGRIGTIWWSQIADAWPGLRSEPALIDLEAVATPGTP